MYAATRSKHYSIVFMTLSLFDATVLAFNYPTLQYVISLRASFLL